MNLARPYWLGLSGSEPADNSTIHTYGIYNSDVIIGRKAIVGAGQSNKASGRARVHYRLTSGHEGRGLRISLCL